MRTGESIGVAISTTGDDHRMAFLETCVKAWRKVLPRGSDLFVTVDGSETEAYKVSQVAGDTASVYRVGQPRFGVSPNNNRMGVAANKNTGLELLMDHTSVQHLFLCDDDTWPLARSALALHVTSPLKHSMVCWGRGRLGKPVGRRAISWSWPRGVALYAERAVVERVGGMDEAFGPGGHEHAEWSKRIYRAGLTPCEFPTPIFYANDRATAARKMWNCEDMARLGEHTSEHRARKRRNTSIQRKEGDWASIRAVMAIREGSDAFVPYQAWRNRRLSATLCEDPKSLGTRAEEPEKPEGCR